MNDLDIGWASGLLEGEGSFQSVRPKAKNKYYPYPAIIVRMTDREPIARLASILGSQVRDLGLLPSGKRLFHTQVCASTAAGWMIVHAVPPGRCGY